MSAPRVDPIPAHLAIDELGPDLCALIGGVGVPLVAATLVTTIPSTRADRACFRLTFADGTVLKGRRVQTGADAERIDILGSFLNPRYFPRVVARQGRALLTDWVQGTSLRPDDCTVKVVRRCGRLHATLHRLVLSPAAANFRRRPLEWEPWLDASLRELVASEAIDVSLATGIARLVVRHAPRAPHAGLCHGDFCAENIIRGAAGAICVVDNDGITVDAYAYDLARTWYRWPMERREQQAYADGYGRSEHGRNFADHFLHWALMVLVGSCKYRVRARVPSMGVPLSRLRAVVESEGRTEGLPRLLGKG